MGRQLKVKEIMERAGTTQTGRAVAYIKDALDEINILAETHVITTRIDINKDQRFYNIPNDMVKMIDIRVKNHLNSKDEYRTVPRLLYPPLLKDADAV